MINDEKNESSNAKTDSDQSQDGSSGDEADPKMRKKRPFSSSDEEKKAERRAANRRSAFQSRQRRKILIEDLQRTVAGLSKDNSDLRKSNDDLRVQLKTVLLENHQLRMQQQHSGNNKVGAPDLMQTSTMFRGAGQQTPLSQLLGTGQLGHQTSIGGGSGGGSSGENDSLLNTRLALLAAQANKGDDNREKSQHASNSVASIPTSSSSGLHNLSENTAHQANGNQQSDQLSAGLQSLMDLIGRQQGLNNASLQGNSQVNPLQSLLENSMFGQNNIAGGQSGGQLGGLSSLLENTSRPPVNQLGAGLAELQRALLSGTNPGNTAGRQNFGSGPKPDSNEGMSISDALRNLLQKHQSS
eukprot:scaffold2003_cov139-Cylindrotheca_fusiformis.AAC.10